VTPVAKPSWDRFFEEFHCRECGGQEACRSRPRNFFEKRVLPVFLLRAVRCQRCYHRGYVWRTIPAFERVQPERKELQSQRLGASKSDGRVA
jgi:hypothetical protein